MSQLVIIKSLHVTLKTMDINTSQIWLDNIRDNILLYKKKAFYAQL